MPSTLYMVVEHFKNKDAVAVYRRFRDRGRMAPEGLTYLSSWVDDKLERCYLSVDGNPKPPPARRVDGELERPR
jgi:hypothetical protein